MKTLKIGVVGGGTAVLDVLGVVAAHQWLGLPLALSAVLAFVLASALHFVLHRSWVFGSSGCPRRQGVRYLGLLAGNLAVTAVGVPLLAGLGMDYRLAKVLVTVLVGLGNLAVLHLWVFAHRPRSGVRVHVPQQRPALVPA